MAQKKRSDRYVSEEDTPEVQDMLRIIKKKEAAEKKTDKDDENE